jgi:hypothetical protein
MNPMLIVTVVALVCLFETSLQWERTSFFTVQPMVILVISREMISLRKPVLPVAVLPGEDAK